MPDDAPVNRILAVLLEKMNFPQYAPDGQPLSYKFHHKASGKQLLDTQTLTDVGVKERRRAAAPAGDHCRVTIRSLSDSACLPAAAMKGFGWGAGESI